MADTIRIGIAQLNSTSDVDANFDAIARYTHEAARAGCDIVMFPECAPLMRPDAERIEDAQPLDGTQMNFCGDVASANKIAILVGSFAELTDHPYRFGNTSVFFDRKGKVVASYRKAHLFDVDLGPGRSFKESAHVLAGDGKPVVVEFEGWRFGLSICYDLRFPEFYRTLVDAGAEILCVPAAFTYQTGAAHWEVLLRARAIENGAYVVAPAQTGVNYGQRECWGHSMAVSPWGEILAQRGFEPGLTVVELDRARLDAARAKIPALANRRVATTLRASASGETVSNKR